MVLQSRAIQENLVWKIKDLIANNQLSEALFLLRQFSEEKNIEPLKREVVKLDSRLRELSYKTTAGILDENYANVQIGGIVSSALELTEKYYKPLNQYKLNKSDRPGFWKMISNFFH